MGKLPVKQRQLIVFLSSGPILLRHPKSLFLVLQTPAKALPIRSTKGAWQWQGPEKLVLQLIQALVQYGHFLR